MNNRKGLCLNISIHGNLVGGSGKEARSPDPDHEQRHAFRVYFCMCMCVFTCVLMCAVLTARGLVDCQRRRERAHRAWGH